MEKTIRRVLGIDLKMKQYAQGSQFVSTLVEQAGMTGFNKIWTSPETLPTKAELSDPQAWVNRVAGSNANGSNVNGSTTNGSTANGSGGWYGRAAGEAG